MGKVLTDLFKYINQVLIEKLWFDLDEAIANDAQSTKLSRYRVDALIILCLAYRFYMFINNLLFFFFFQFCLVS